MKNDIIKRAIQRNDKKVMSFINRHHDEYESLEDLIHWLFCSIEIDTELVVDFTYRISFKDFILHKDLIMEGRNYDFYKDYFEFIDFSLEDMVDTAEYSLQHEIEMYRGETWMSYMKPIYDTKEVEITIPCLIKKTIPLIALYDVSEFDFLIELLNMASDEDFIEYAPIKEEDYIKCLDSIIESIVNPGKGDK